jgi:hypothetical protein
VRAEAAVPPQCRPLADELATLRAGLPALRDAVAQARSVGEKLQARRELAAAEQAVAAKQREFDACAGVEAPTSVVAALRGDTDILIDYAGDGSWNGALLRESAMSYTFTFLGATAAITDTRPPANVGGGSVSAGPFGLVRGTYFNTMRRAGGVYGVYDAATGHIELPLFLDFDKGTVFPGFWNTIYGTRDRAQASVVLSSRTRLPDALADWPSGRPIVQAWGSSGGDNVLAGLGT